MESTAQLMNIV